MVATTKARVRRKARQPAAKGSEKSDELPAPEVRRVLPFHLPKLRRRAISKGGQISIPAEVRRRWQTTDVWLVDEGDHLLIEPIPEDPIAAAAGSLAGLGQSDKPFWQEWEDYQREEAELEEERYRRWEGR